jgi:hypothetical protein
VHLQFFTSAFVTLHNYPSAFLKPVIKRFSKPVHAADIQVVQDFCIFQAVTRSKNHIGDKCQALPNYTGLMEPDTELRDNTCQINEVKHD